MRRIDLHCYPGTAPWIASQGPYVEALATYWKRPWVAKDENDVAAELESLGIEAVLGMPVAQLRDVGVAARRGVGHRLDVEGHHGHEIAAFKLPERLEVMESFPLLPIGKVSKKDLVARFAPPLVEKARGRP